jgi:hypothetical protein
MELTAVLTPAEEGVVPLHSELEVGTLAGALRQRRSPQRNS